jgi:hypothetical protein
MSIDPAHDVTTQATFELHRHSTAVTEPRHFYLRHHSLAMDHGWNEVVDAIPFGRAGGDPRRCDDFTHVAVRVQMPCRSASAGTALVNHRGVLGAGGSSQRVAQRAQLRHHAPDKPRCLPPRLRHRKEADPFPNFFTRLTPSESGQDV